MNFDEKEMWQYSDIMRDFVHNYIDKLEPAEHNEIVEASVEDADIWLDPLLDEPKLINKVKDAEILISKLNKISEKYNNEKVSYAIELAISEIKAISGLDQE